MLSQLFEDDDKLLSSVVNDSELAKFKSEDDIMNQFKLVDPTHEAENASEFWKRVDQGFNYVYSKAHDGDKMRLPYRPGGSDIFALLHRDDGTPGDAGKLGYGVYSDGYDKVLQVRAENCHYGKGKENARKREEYVHHPHDALVEPSSEISPHSPEKYPRHKGDED